MPQPPAARTDLPLPSWWFAILGVSTFVSLFAYLAFVVWVILRTSFGQPVDSPAWMELAVVPILVITFCLWPLYFIWIVATQRLTWGEKLLWSCLVLLLNIAAMAVFYVFMLRRYLGLEARTNERDQGALESLLDRHGIQQSDLSVDQIDILRMYCRHNRLAKAYLIPFLVLALVLLYFTAFVLPQRFVDLFADLHPPHVQIRQNGAELTRGVAADRVTWKSYVEVILLYGAFLGALVMQILLLIMTLLSRLFHSNRDRKTLINLLKTLRGERFPPAPGCKV